MTCIVCHAPAVHMHHCVTRQALRRGVKTRGYLTALVTDDRNLVPMCLRCHGRHHNRMAPIPMDVLPDSVIDFAVEVMGASRAYGYFNRHYGCPSEGDPRLERMLDAA